MNCIICGSKAKRIDVSHNDNKTYRKIVCTKCGARFCTEENLIEDYNENLRVALSIYYREENERKKK